MKFTICCTSGTKPKANGFNITNIRRDHDRANGWLGDVELETIDDLARLREKFGYNVILVGSSALEIYDCYRE